IKYINRSVHKLKKIILSALLAVSLIGLSACGGGSSEAVVKTDAGDITKEEYYQELKTKYGDEVLTELVTMAVLDDKYDVSDEEVETYFENQGYQIEAQHILLTDEELAEKVAKEAQDDGDFAKLAEKYSTDEENAKEGGELPPFGVGEMTPAFEEAVFEMEEG